MVQQKILDLGLKEFAELFNIRNREIPSIAKKIIKNSNFNYKKVNDADYKQIILRIFKTLDSGNLKPSGPHRLKDWEKGWSENYQNFKKNNFNLNELIPKFIKKNEPIRLKGKFVQPINPNFETDFVSVLRYYLFSKYFKDVSCVYEFGCGTNLNLIAVNEIFPDKKLVGLDWTKSSYRIIEQIRKKFKIDISFRAFDLFAPDESYKLDLNSGVLTIGTLEQLGADFIPFTEYLIKNKPKICIHIEPLYELYDSGKLEDYLAAKYSDKRNYLRGFLPYLKELEQSKKIEILEINRAFGTFYHDGYSYVIWKMK